MRIEVSQLPPASSSPNWRGHWAERYKAARIYQAAVFYECVDVRNRLMALGEWEPFRKARLDLIFVFPNYRKRDEDNLRARFKPGQDALVQADLLEGDTVDDLVLGDINIEVSPTAAPLTIIELKELEGEEK